MSGCVWQYTAAYVNNGNGNLATFGNSLANAANQYKDIYTSSGDTSSGNYLANSAKTGDAMYETSTSDVGSTAWYGDFTSMPYSNNLFYIRGGEAGSNANAGLFAFYGCVGGASWYVGFRPVIVVNGLL